MAKKIQDGNQIVTNVDSNDNLTFSIKSSFIDSTPTVNSTNLVTSGGVKSALDINTTDIAAAVIRIVNNETNISNNTTNIGTLSNLTTTDKTSVVNAVNELDTDKLETSAIVNEASTETDEVYSSDYLNDKLVSVGAEAPSDGRRVWFKKGQNLFDASTIVAGDIKGADQTIRLSSRQALWLKEGTYTFSTNQPSPFRYSIAVQNVGVPPLSSYPTYILNSGWQTLSSYTFTLTSPGYVVVTLSKENNAQLTVSELTSFSYQLEKGSTASSFEPYIEPSIYVDEEEWYNSNMSKYSTNEIKIGTWIDGKPLYRKVISFTPAGNIPANTWTTIFNYTFNNLKQLIKSTVLNTDSTNTGELNWLTVQYFANDNAFKGLHTRNMTVTLPINSLIIVEYTKITD